MTAGAARRLRRPRHCDNSLDPAGRAHRPRRARRPGADRPSTPTWWPASPTTSPRGRTATAAPSCSAATSRFVLSTSGHIAALVNPPGNPKATFQVNSRRPDATPRLAPAARTPTQGSWWPDFAAWLGRALRRGNVRRPPTLGGGGLTPLADAPAPTSSTTEGTGTPCSTPTASAARWAPTTSASPTSSPTQERDYWRRTRDFVDDEVLPVINDYWERAEFPRGRWSRRLGELGIVGDGIEGYGCPPMSPIANGLIHHGAQPRRRQPRHLPRCAGRAGHAVDRHARLGGADSSGGCRRWPSWTTSAPSR